MTQEITQAAMEVGKAVIMAVEEAENQVNTARSVQGMPRADISALK